MSEKHKDQTLGKTNLVGVVIGAALALIFAKTGNPGLIGVGAIIGMAIGKGLNRRSGRQITLKGD
jgi:hypothetical protein